MLGRRFRWTGTARLASRWLPDRWDGGGEGDERERGSLSDISVQLSIEEFGTVTDRRRIYRGFR